MSVAIRPKIFSALSFFSLLIVLVFAGFFAQTPQQSPSPSPDVSPSPSPSTTPVRTPSPTPLPGAQNFHQWGSITVFNGLPSDSVRAIVQTHDGVMWFGTDNGLARFDGRRIQNFSPGGTDESNRILALEYDDKGVLYVGTRAGAFSYYRDRFEPIVGTESYTITSLLLWDLLYFGTDAGLVLRRNLNENGQSVIEPLFRDVIRTVEGAPVSVTSLITTGDQLLAGTAGSGVFAVSENGSAQFQRAPNVNILLRDRNGTLWIGSDAPKAVSGLYVTSSGIPSTRISAPTSRVLSLDENESGVWAGSERFGLFHFTGLKLKKNYTFENTSGGLRSNTVYTLFTDREGVLWIGTNRGVSRFDRLGAEQQTVSEIPNSNFIRTLYQAPGEQGLLYAGSNRGLFTFDHEKDTWSEVPAFRNKVIYAVRKRYGSSIVVGGPGGLFDISGSRLLDGDVRGFAGFNVRDYAAVFGKGIFDVTDDVPKLVVPNPTVTTVGERWNKLWIGTLDSGLFSYAGNAMISEAGPDKLNSGTIWNVWNISHGSASGPAYIAGQHGVFVVREDGNVERIVEAEDVRDVFERDGHVWAASTTRGLIHGRRDDRFGWLFSSIAFEQGLPSEKAFSIQPAGDWLIVATNRGVVTYKPGLIAPKLIPIRLLSQRKHDFAELASKIYLEYPQTSLLVEVAGQSSRTFPEEFQYAFVLTNAKGEEVDRRISNDAQYAPADLAAGDYTIEAIAFNRDLIASEPLFIRFSVAKAPFPWTATALGILLAIALVGLVWAAFEHRRLTQRNRELAAARLDLANEAERERRRIARDLHDQTLADLRNLMMRTDKSSPQNPEFRTEIEAVSGEIRRICEDLSPSVLENVGLIAALEFLLDSTFENRRFSVDDDLEDRIKLPMNVQLQIYRIAQEVLTNIRRHSNADHVEMAVEINGNGQLKLKIDDNGTPFHPDGNSAKGRGIANIRARASLVNAKLSWKETHGGGNRFALSIEGLHI